MPGTIASALRLDVEAAVESIVHFMRWQLSETLRRKGFVVGMSGGVDSSVCAALAARAAGADRVFALFLPERESDPDSLRIAAEFARQLGISHATEDIAPILEGAGCYRRRNDAIRRVVPEFRDDWGCKLALPAGGLEPGRINVSSIVVRPPEGEEQRVRLPPAEYREIVAASNFKQRARAMMEYFHADRLHYAVVGTPNRLEYEQGFFVKGGDGLADLKPIAHLYKTQVYQFAEFLGVPVAVTSRPPTTDTFSLPQSQEEFYYLLPTSTLDQVMYAHEAGLAPEFVAEEVGLTPDQVRAAYRDVEQKRVTTRYLHLGPQLAEHVDLGWAEANEIDRMIEAHPTTAARPAVERRAVIEALP